MILKLKDIKVDKILRYLLERKINFLETNKYKYIKDFDLDEALEECRNLVFLYKNFG